MAGEFCLKNKSKMAKPMNEVTPGIETFLIYKEILTE